MLDTAWQDLKVATRILRRTPSFALSAVAMLAVGVGAAAAILSVVDAALLRPLPFPEPERLYALTDHAGAPQSGETFHLVRERVWGFDAMAAAGPSAGWNLVVGGRAAYVRGRPVSADYFQVFGGTPLAGRTFSVAEDTPGGGRALVISEALWRRTFDARVDIVGQVVRLGTVPHTIVGVMPATFEPIPPADVWTPLRLLPNDDSAAYEVTGRLKREASLYEVDRQMAVVRSHVVPVLGPDAEYMRDRLHWIPYRRAVAREGRQTLLLLLGAAAMVLLIASANVAGLQAVRTIGRRGELAMRVALGSSAMRLLTLLLVETLLLALVATGLGLVLAQFGLVAFAHLVPPSLVSWQPVGVDARVLAIATAITVPTGLVFGLVPAWNSMRFDVCGALWSGGARQTSGRGAVWLRRAFTSGQIALATVLLIGAGLLVRTLMHYRAVELGFDHANVVTAHMSLQGAVGQGDVESALVDRAESRLRELPHVELIAAATSLPLEQGVNLPVQVPGSRVDGSRAVDWRAVTPDYFALFRIRQYAGRPFSRSDAAGAVSVAIVNRAFVRAYFGPEEPIGRSIRLEPGIDPAAGPWLIVGVVDDVRIRSAAAWGSGESPFSAPPPPTIYVPLAQGPPKIMSLVSAYFPMAWAVRTRSSTAAEIASIEEALHSADPRVPVIAVQSMHEIVENALRTERLRAALAATFGLVATSLAAFGLYGMIAYSVRQRRVEIAIRKALGATPRLLIWHVVSEGLRLTIVGLAIGIVVAFGSTKLLSSLVFGLGTSDPVTFVSAALLLTVIAAVACLLPAVRGAWLEPARWLRSN